MNNTVNIELVEYVENAVKPCYEHCDAAHDWRHIARVIESSLELAREYDANVDMAYAIAAFHDIGIPEGRKMHHISSARIILEDVQLRRWFTDEQLAMMHDAIEDHRASSERPPRTIYGGIVAEADRDIRPAVILQRVMAYGMSKFPELSEGEQLERAYEHVVEKYGENGYLRCWLHSERNERGLRELRELLSDRTAFNIACLRAICGHAELASPVIPQDRKTVTAPKTP